MNARARAERQRVEGELRAPDRGDGEQSREDEEEVLRDDEPQRTRGEEEVHSMCCMRGIHASGAISTSTG